MASRDCKDGGATGKPQGVGSEAYLNGTSQDPTPEDPRKDGHICGRSRRFVKHAGCKFKFKFILTRVKKGITTLFTFVE